MGFRIHPWLVVALVLLLCAAAVMGLWIWRGRGEATSSWLAQRLPAGDGLTVGIDVEALRRGGILRAIDQTGIGGEPDYQDFVRETGFNYEQDLDYVLIRFAGDRNFFLLKGRFNWPQLRRYAEQQRGVCRNAVCEMEGSSPSRVISFLPLRANVMAMAVGPEPWLVWELAQSAKPLREEAPPAAAIWIRLRPSDLKEAKLPEALRQVLAAMGESTRLQFTLSAASDGFEALLEVVCRDAAEASLLADQLQSATMALSRMNSSRTSGDGQSLTDVLAGGTFRAENNRLLGRWPIERAFAEGILGVSR